MGNIQAINRRQNFFSHTFCPFRRGVGHQHNKFFSAITRCQITGALQMRFEHIGDLSQGIITLQVTVGVVVGFEVVNINKDDRERLTRCARSHSWEKVSLR